MATDKLLDKDVKISNYASFEKCDISSDGKTVNFIMTCGSSYFVPLGYFLKWFSCPHYLLSEGRLIEWGESEHKPDEDDILFATCERILSNTALRVSLSNGAVYDVSWDTVLMACEERYEYFGGLTNESRSIVKKWREAKSY